MKNLLSSIFTIVFIIAISMSCGTSSGFNTNEDIKDKIFYRDLADRLRAEGGINVMGSGQNVSIVIRGIQTITGDTRPIFVIDGLNMGRDYNLINNSINVNDIRRIKVLKGKSETALYGEAGNNGVIILTMRK
jgi:TonB-dependent SusC/RagA subfamily outer membrane receptor